VLRTVSCRTLQHQSEHCVGWQPVKAAVARHHVAYYALVCVPLQWRITYFALQLSCFCCLSAGREVAEAQVVLLYVHGELLNEGLAAGVDCCQSMPCKRCAPRSKTHGSVVLVITAACSGW
jgi:hypothetical protein